MGKIIRKTLGQEAVDEIREMIATGELKPGAGIVEQDLADRLGVSRGPVREALRQLEQEGVVEYKTNRGCFVRELTQMDILENMILQVQLEMSVLELVEGKLPDGVIKKMSRAVDEMASDGHNFTFPKMIEEDRNFHRNIMEVFPFKKMQRIWNEINQGNVVLLRYFRQDEEGIMKKHKEIHEELLTAIKTKDIDVIRRAMKKHYMDVVSSLMPDEMWKFRLDELQKEQESQTATK